MEVKTERITVTIDADGGMENITDQVQDKVTDSGLNAGILCVFIPGATGSVSTVEFEPGLQKDIPKALERIAPPISLMNIIRGGEMITAEATFEPLSWVPVLQSLSPKEN